MLFLPEACSFIGQSAQETVAHASPLEGPVLGRYRDLAQRLGLWISCGGFQETSPDPARLYNTHVLLNPQGEIVEAYRKIHLFDHDKLTESRSTAPGREVRHAETPAGRVGLMVCYDLRFPWLSDRLRFDHGCDILTYPSAFTMRTGQAHWELLLRARAAETQCYVVAAAQTGRHNPKRESYGHAMIIDPWGTIVTQLDDPEATGIACADINLELVMSTRLSMPIDRHRAAAKSLCEPDCAID